MIEIARLYAKKAHTDVNQKYHDQSYVYHLQMVVTIAHQYIDLIPEEDKDEVIAGCWVHDVIEDTGQTYNDVKRNTNEVVAEYAYALTNEKGRTRKDRANKKYYKGIKEYKHAIFIKLCDRFANSKYSKEHGSSMFKQYQKEMHFFKLHLYDMRYQILWDDLTKYTLK